MRPNGLLRRPGLANGAVCKLATRSKRLPWDNQRDEHMPSMLCHTLSCEMIPMATSQLNATVLNWCTPCDCFAVARRSKWRWITIRAESQGHSWPDIAGQCCQAPTAGSLVDRNHHPPHQALGQFAVRIHLDDEDHEKFPIGAHGGGDLFRRGAFAALRRISVRAYH